MFFTRWMEKILEKKGNTVLEILISISLITFVLFYPLFTFAYTHKVSLLEDVLTTGMQMVAVQGGLTDQVANTIYLNFEAKGMLPPSDLAARNNVKLASNADARGGNTANLIYRDSADPKIYFEIQYPADREVNFINGLSKMIGGSGANLPFNTSGAHYYTVKGWIMSEKVNY